MTPTVLHYLPRFTYSITCHYSRVLYSITKSSKFTVNLHNTNTVILLKFVNNNGNIFPYRVHATILGNLVNRLERDRISHRYLTFMFFSFLHFFIPYILM